MFFKTRFACVALAISIAFPAFAVDPRPGDEAIEKSLTGETKLLSLNVLAEADSREAWEAKREELKRQYWDMLGLWPVFGTGTWTSRKIDQVL
jgi:hypothetical protein